MGELVLFMRMELSSAKNKLDRIKGIVELRRTSYIQSMQVT